METVLVGVPSFGDLSVEFVQSHEALMCQMVRDNYQPVTVWERRTGRCAARDSIVSLAISEGCDWLLMIDNDHVFERDVFAKLREWDEDFVVPLMMGRHFPFPLMAYQVKPFDPAKPNVCHGERLREWNEGGLTEIGSAGLGMALCRVSALAKLERPYFGNALEMEGEDVHFWQRVKDAGFKLHLDGRVSIGHLVSEPAIVTIADTLNCMETSQRIDSTDKLRARQSVKEVIQVG